MKNSEISWCDHTFNPWIGCSKVSPGCDHCYAETLMATRYGRVEWGVNGTRVRTSAANWKQPVAWNRAAGRAGERHRVFCASLADVFEGDPGDKWGLRAWRDELFALIMATPNLDWMLLTKRPAKAASFFRDSTPTMIACRVGDGIHGVVVPPTWPLPNLWMGTTVEDQRRAVERVPELLKIPAAVRFLSCEPLLGSVDVGSWIKDGGINWVIVGGESGHGARPMEAGWVQSLRDQCLEADVPFHFKQWGEWAPEDLSATASARSMPMIRMGKGKAGRLLDGATWDQFPNNDATTQQAA